MTILANCQHSDTVKIRTMDQYVQHRCTECFQMVTPHPTLMQEAEDLLYDAWGVIANGPWLPDGSLAIEHGQWREAAERWRDSYHAHLARQF